MKIEFDIEIGSGIWKPAEDLIVMARDAFDLRHKHDNKEILDKFEINTAKTKPVFNGEVLASQGDVTTRVTELRTVTPNHASVEDSELKLQRKVGSDITDLFSVELPENDSSGLTEEQANNLEACLEEKHSHDNSDVLNNITAVESEVKSDSDNPVSSSAVAGEIGKIHGHENKEVLDCFGTDDAGNVTFNGTGIGQRRVDTEIFDYISDDSTERLLLICDYDCKISGKEIAKIEFLDTYGTWHDADGLCGKDFENPSIRINKYVEFSELTGADILGYYTTFKAEKPGWYIMSFDSVRVTYYL